MQLCCLGSNWVDWNAVGTAHGGESCQWEHMYPQEGGRRVAFSQHMKRRTKLLKQLLKRSLEAWGTPRMQDSFQSSSPGSGPNEYLLHAQRKRVHHSKSSIWSCQMCSGKEESPGETQAFFSNQEASPCAGQSLEPWDQIRQSFIEHAFK